MGLLFLGSGTPTFWLGLLLFIKWESRTPTFKILVRTLHIQEVDVAGLLPRQGSLIQLDKFAHGPTEKNDVYLRGYISWLVGDEMAVTFLETCAPKKQVEC